jgi:hypothetical protein
MANPTNKLARNGIMPKERNGFNISVFPFDAAHREARNETVSPFSLSRLF